MNSKAWQWLACAARADLSSAADGLRRVISALEDEDWERAGRLAQREFAEVCEREESATIIERALILSQGEEWFD